MNEISVQNAAAAPGRDERLWEQEMSNEAVDRFLAGLASAVRDFLRESEEEHRRRDRLMEAGETLLERRDRSLPTYVDCRLALSSIREQLAIDSATSYRRMARELACWWLDAATVALAGAAAGTPVTAVRMGAGNPRLPMDDEAMAQLPEVDEWARQMVEFAARLGPVPRQRGGEAGAPGAAGAAEDDLMSEALALASRSGLVLRQDAGGRISAADDPWPEARRCRLWGEFWTEHRIPSIPAVDELAALLTGVREETAERLMAGARAVGRTVLSEMRLAQLGRQETDLTAEEADEYDRLADEADRLTDRLADYAALITDSLPAVRAAAAARA